jgi:hypothetical protein
VKNDSLVLLARTPTMARNEDYFVLSARTPTPAKYCRVGKNQFNDFTDGQQSKKKNMIFKN